MFWISPPGAGPRNTKALHRHSGAVDVPHQLHRENFGTAIRPIAEATVVQHRGLLGIWKNAGENEQQNRDTVDLSEILGQSIGGFYIQTSHDFDGVTTIQGGFGETPTYGWYQEENEQNRDR